MRLVTILFWLFSLASCSQEKLDFGKVGVSKALSNGWVAVDKTGGSVRLLRKAESVVDDVQKMLEALALGDSTKVSSSDIQQLKKRKLVSEMYRVDFKKRNFAFFDEKICENFFQKVIY